MPSANPFTPVLRANAAAYARVALANIEREFPSDVWQLLHGPDDPRPRPRDRTPVFFGSLDWHSCVEMHWLLVRLLRTVPDAIPADEIVAALDARFTPGALAAEAAFIAHPDNRNRERPYGWGWALALVAEVDALDLDSARRWAVHLRPLADAVTANFLGWLPKATYPVRYGVHSNSAFGLSLARRHALDRREAGDGALLAAIDGAALRWFSADADAPAAWEPSGFDFLSPALVEAELMTTVLPSDRAAGWLSRFLPGLADGKPATLFAPAVVSDASDPHIAHLHGLNASRAWCWRRLADFLPSDDPRAAIAIAAMRRHADAALPHVVGDDYMVEHWLAAYAVLLMS